jgi:RHS repeat-associated protein
MADSEVSALATSPYKASSSQISFDPSAIGTTEQDKIAFIISELYGNYAQTIHFPEDTTAEQLRDFLLADFQFAVPSNQNLTDDLNKLTLEIIEEQYQSFFSYLRQRDYPVSNPETNEEQYSCSAEPSGTGDVYNSGDPVNLFNGNFLYSATDLHLNGAGIDFTFTRNYSQLTNYNGPIGFNWDHNYNLWIKISDDDLSAAVSTGTGQVNIYKKHSLFDYYLPPEGTVGILVSDISSFVIELTDGGKITYQPHASISNIYVVSRIEDRFDNYLAFSYNEGLLDHVTVNRQDREVFFEYDDHFRIISIKDFMGRSWRYSYDDLGDLVCVTTPVTAEFKNGFSCRYEYSTTKDANHNLTSIIDANGQIFLENEFGGDRQLLNYNRVIRQRQGNGEMLFDYENVIEEFEFYYELHERPFCQTIVTERDGSQIRYLFNSYGNLIFKEQFARLNGIPKLVSSIFRYNRDGNLVALISPLGSITQFLFGRDYYEKKYSHDEDYRYDTDANLTKQVRKYFNNLLAVVKRANFYSLQSLDLSKGIWSKDIFPDIYDTNEYDVIQKFKYEEHYFQLASSSDARFTSSADPDFTESPNYYKHLTKYDYDFINPHNHFHLRSVSFPNPTLPDGSIGDPVITTLENYDAKGKLLKTIAPDGTLTLNSYFESSDGRREGYLRQVRVDPNGLNIISGTERDELGRITKTYRPKYFDFLDQRFFSTYEYNEHDQVIRSATTSPMSITRFNSYDRTGKIVKSKTELKDSANFLKGFYTVEEKFDEEFNLLSQKSGNFETGEVAVSKIVYNSSGQVSLVITPSGSKNKVLYNERGLQWQFIGDYGKIHASARNYFDADGRLIKTVDVGGNSTSFVHDALGRVIKRIDALGNVLVNHYDKNSNLIVECCFEKLTGGYKLLARREHRYDEIGRKIIVGFNKFDTAPIIPEQNLVTSYIVNGPGLLLENKFFYSNIGTLYKTIDQGGKILKAEFDRLGRVTKKTDPNGNEISYEYDKENNITRVDRKEVVRDKNTNSIVNYRFFAETAMFDELNRIIEATNTLGNKTMFLYDSQNNLTQITDAANRKTIHYYDSFNRLVRQDKLQNIPGAPPMSVMYAYNKFDRIEQQTDSLGRIITFNYDTAGRLLSSILPNGKTDSTNYNFNGTIDQFRDRSGVITNYKYDKLNRVTEVQVDPSHLQDPDEFLGALTYKTTYDGMGRIISMENDFAKTDFIYNSLGWTLEEVNIFKPALGLTNLTTSSIKRGYDDSGLQSEITYPSGRKIHYDRDILNRIITIRQTQKGNAFPGNNALPNNYVIAEIEYDGLQRKKIARKNNTATEFRYDQGNRLLEIIHVANAEFLHLQFLYDAVNNIKYSVEVSTEMSRQRAFQYDSFSQLKAVREKLGSTPLLDLAELAPSNIPIPSLIPNYQSIIDDVTINNLAGPAKIYNYDLNHNRTSVVSLGTINDYQVNLLDQYNQVDQNVFEFDDNGNLKTDAHFRHAYNHLHQLSKVKEIGTNREMFYLHDALDRPIWELKDGKALLTIYDGIEPVEEYKDSTLTTSLVSTLGSNSLITISKGGAELYLYTDLTNSVRYIFKDSQKEEHYFYDEFGNVILSSNNQESPFRFQGKRFLSDLNKYDFFYRVYDPLIGRFLQRDPKNFIDGTNPYSFAGNNPLTAVDSMGLEREEVKTAKDFFKIYKDRLEFSVEDKGNDSYRLRSPEGSTLVDLSFNPENPYLTSLISLKSGSYSFSEFNFERDRFVELKREIQMAEYTRKLSFLERLNNAGKASVKVATGTFIAGAGCTVTLGFGCLAALAYGSDVAATGFEDAIYGGDHRTIANKALTYGLSKIIGEDRAQHVTDFSEKIFQMYLTAKLSLRGPIPATPNPTTPPPPPVSPQVTLTQDIDQILLEARDVALRNVQMRPGAAGLRPMDFGNLMDDEFKLLVQENINTGRLPNTLRLTPRGRFGVDVYDTATSIGYDLTTATVKEVAGHDARYIFTIGQRAMPDGTIITDVRPITYMRNW